MSDSIKVSKFSLIPLIPKIIKLIKVYFISIKDGELSKVEATDLVENCLYPILETINISIPKYLKEVLPELVMKIHKTSIIIINQSEAEGV